MPSAKHLNGGADVALDEVAFGAPFNGPLVHESVRAELAARRQGTHATKTRGNVRGGGAKPWRQKGTGRARQGSIRAPHWTGGGTVFGPSPRHYTFKVNRKERRAALRSALSVHAERASIFALDPASLVETPSAKTAAKLLKDGGLAGSVLVVLTDAQSRAALSFRNLAQVRAVLPAQDIGVADLIGAAHVVASPEALQALASRAKGEKQHQPEEVAA
jgi:large subunit ribosomal protein L4